MSHSKDLSHVNVSLYFHIPFCTRKCSYCHFYVLPDKSSFKAQLADALEQEWAIRLPLLKDKRIVSIYFGGGTPALFGAAAIERILQRIQCTTHLSNDCEITLEANPENVNLQLMKEYRSAGVNRISIGLQTLDDQLLPRLGRLHTAQKGIDAVLMANQVGFFNISVDLMYELPNQTLESWHSTLEKASTLPLTHISLYNLTIEPETRFFKQRAALQPLLPDQETGAQMYRSALHLLENAGLLQYEISAFAKPTYSSKHNIGYWTARPFLGFGPSAFSYWEGKRFQNVPHFNQYLQACAENRPAIGFEEVLEPQARLKELLAVQLRLTEGVHLPDFEEQHGKLPLSLRKTIADLEVKGMLWQCCTSHKLSLTQKGLFFYDTVATELI